MNEPLYEDPVVAEIHAIRVKMLEECGGDHRKLMEKVYQRQKTSGHVLIPVPKLPPRKQPGFLPVGHPKED